jgi:hypothetical protein
MNIRRPWGRSAVGKVLVGRGDVAGHVAPRTLVAGRERLARDWVERRLDVGDETARSYVLEAGLGQPRAGAKEVQCGGKAGQVKGRS